MNSCESLEPINSLIQGAYDLHMHAAPSPFHRLMDDFQLLKAADEAEMAGILLKSHYESTGARAEIANSHCSSKARAFGSIVLNWPVGGLNPFAVYNAMKHGVRMVFMPTRDAQNSLKTGNMPGDFFNRRGISILKENDTLKPEVLEIMDIVKQNDAILATGHISPKESVILCQEGVRHGVRMVLTHPEFSRTRMNSEGQRELAQLGVTIEKCWYNIAENECSASQMAKNIRMVGSKHCYLSTDRGQSNRESPVEALKLFISALLHEGITTDEIFQMTHTVPSEIINN